MLPRTASCSYSSWRRECLDNVSCNGQIRGCAPWTWQLLLAVVVVRRVAPFGPEDVRVRAKNAVSYLSSLRNYYIIQVRHTRKKLDVHTV